ncbi:carboxypeptidase-like regulatory domain-containing protein [uncultured Tessaracoccus sp.]|uniref:carboxypeptidase-like regulatory domain-containing protein n=1 Tax=uncultured Tessaracoccus sp. TaxID=905023 RepID=UPI002632F2D5|nr:carboxypeptidase-like regulatory domain-containing protein [uncultured Tessaracoccus sp.]
MACLSLLSTPAHAAETKIDARVHFDGQTVNVYGVLIDDEGYAVNKGSVSASLGGRNMATSHPTRQGTFDMRFPVPPGMSGSQDLIVRFSGHGKDPAATASITLTVPSSDTRAAQADQPHAASPADSDSQEAPSATPSPPPTTQLSAKADLPEPSNGSFVTISGKLVSPAGDPVSDAGILLFSPAGEVEEGYAVTAANGTFTTHYEIPVEAKGDHQLTLKFEGGGGIPAAETPVVLKVQHKEIAKTSPTPSEPPSPTATPSPDNTASATPAAPASDDAKGTSASSDGGGMGRMLAWFAGGLVAVGGVAAVAAAVVASRVRRDSSAGAAQPESALLSEDGLFSDDEDAPPAPAPRRAAH